LKIEQATGVKPTIIYTFFLPRGIRTDSQAAETAVLQVEPQPTDELELVLVTSKSKPIRRLVPGATREKVLKEAKKFKSAVTSQESINDESFLASAKNLYHWLITPLKNDLETQCLQNLGLVNDLQRHCLQNMVFVMDKDLRSLPLAALYNDQDNERGFLVEKYSVGLMPSMSLTDTRYTDLKKGVQVLAMGAKEFPAEFKQRPLPAAPVELAVITSRLWPGKSFPDKTFTLYNLKLQRDKTPFGIVHLATHADFKFSQPDESFIQLSDTQLRFEQLRQLGWNKPPVELLVLSACRTVEGDADNELGFAGFAHRAGVKSVLGSLWYANDDGTLALMIEFYRELRNAPIKAEALRQAQITMLKGPKYSEIGQLLESVHKEGVILPPELEALEDNKDLSKPYYWAAFMMVGNPW
jgi:CHAT domain-containing protein